MRSLPLLRPAGLAALLAIGAAGASAGPAAAESITYVDGQTHNVWAENVDGSERRQLTTDATDTLRYSFPSTNDNGDLAVLLRNTNSSGVSINLFPRGGERIMNLMPVWGGGVVIAPFGARLQPQGRLLAYSFGNFTGSSGISAGNVVPADAPGSPTGPGPGFPNMRGATWHGDKLVWTNGEALAYGTGAETTAWISGADFGEVSRDGSRLLAKLNPSERLAFQALSGPMPGQVDSATGGCFVPYTGAITPDLALSPSGRWIAFKDGNGLNIAQVDIPAGGGETCTLTNLRTVGGGAEDPAFSAFTFAPPQQPPVEQPPGRQPTEQPRDRNGGGKSGPKATVGKVTLKAALKRGLAVRLSGLKKGRTTVSAKLGRKLVASARVKVPASGKASLRLRFTAAGRRALRGKKSATLTIVAGKARTTVKLK
jgi:hypothetical protein